MTRAVVSHGRRIEVETVETDDTPRPRRRGKHKHMGAPWAVWVTLCKANLDWLTIVLAIYIYRRTKVLRSGTVTLVAADLEELGIYRSGRRRALRQLAGAGIVRLEQAGPGRSVRVELMLRGGP